MFLTIAALLSVAAPTGTTNVDVNDLSGVFEATCLDGQAHLSAGEVSPISFDQLPSGLRESLGRPATARVWRLNAAGRAYLYVLDYADAPGSSPKICGLASDTMNLTSATDRLQLRVTGQVNERNARTAQWLNAKDGYVATATTAASFNVLQISWLSQAGREASLVQVNQIQH